MFPIDLFLSNLFEFSVVNLIGSHSWFRIIEFFIDEANVGSFIGVEILVNETDKLWIGLRGDL